MAIVKMKRLRAIALEEQRDELLARLLHVGCVEVTEPEDCLTDPEWTALLAKDLDTYNEADGVAERGDFIVSPEGKVVAYEVISSNVGRNADELLRRVQASQFVYEHGDQVCPAKWTPGEETIEPSLDLVGLL